METKGERRAEKQRKKRQGMKVTGRSVQVLQEQIVKRAEEAKRQEEERER